ncbi:MAG: VRR-NUC domain-containing protein, partial [Clostridiales bacterium]|nr:VRR-NUC domain-containing protein [Clostridiales bacterium]
MSEKEIEAYLRIRIKKLGGIAYKFTSPGNDGVPDRIVLLPKGA